MWLRVEAVPAGTSRAAVLGTLEAWREWAKYAAPGVGGSLTLVPLARLGKAEGLDSAPAVSWAALSPAERRVTLAVSGAGHAALVRAARRRGLALQSWAVDRLREAAAAELGEPPLPFPTFAGPGVAAPAEDRPALTRAQRPRAPR